MNIKNTSNIKDAKRTNRRRSALSRAFIVSLGLGVLVAGIAVLANKMRNARQADSATYPVLSEPAQPSKAEATREPAPAGQRQALDSQHQAQQKRSVISRPRAGSVAKQTERLIARAKMLERATLKQALAPTLTAVEKTPNPESIPQEITRSASLPSTDVRADSAATSADPSSIQAKVSGLATLPPYDPTPRWIQPPNRRSNADASTASASKVAPGVEATRSEALTVKPTAPSNAESADQKPASASGLPQKGEGVSDPKGTEAEINKLEMRKGLEAALSKAREEAKKKGPEFRTAVGMKSATTVTSTSPNLATPKPAATQEPLPDMKVEISIPEPTYPTEFLGDVRLLPQGITEDERKRFSERVELKRPEPKEPKKPLPGADAEVQPKAEAAPSPGAPMPAPLQTFKGLDFATWGAGFPPDTVGDVGPNHYIQAVNTSIGIYNKTGTQLAAFTFNTFFAGAAAPCAASNQGDPTVIYSRQNNRWIVADFAWTNTLSGPYYECIAVSKTSDPIAGGWWLYAYQAHPSWLNDYPKMGIWPDGLYMSANMFDCLNSSCTSATYKGVRVYALDLADLVTGAALSSVVGDLGDTRWSLLPSNYRGAAPPVGRENFFVQESEIAFAFEIYKFHVDWVTPSNSTLSGPTLVTQASYTSPPATVPSPGNALDSLGERVMMQNQYRNILGVESLWLNHTVGTGVSPAPVGIQWAQINVTGGVIVSPPVQQQIYGNIGGDGVHRWMGALAVDNQGNMALGYSASSATLNPDIRYAGRLVTDPLNTLPQTEVTMLPGVTRGAQNGGIDRWGDYSSMSIDPSDECTFWYTQEYYAANGTNWQTRIGSFKFPTCISAPTAAKVKSFTADGFDGGRVLLRWNSGHEVDNLGYNVYRETNGQRTKINPQIIAGSALVTGPTVALTAGKSYAWGDQLPHQGARYWLEDIDLSGKSTWTGPVNLSAKGGRAPSTQESVLLTRIGLASSQMTLGQGSVTVERKAEIATPSSAAMSLQNDLARHAAVKVGVKQEGWYRVSQSELIAAGLNSNADARNLQLFVDGLQVPIVVNGELDGRLDASDSVEFYGVGLNSAATDTRVYWLVVGGQPGARIKPTKTNGSQTAPGSYTASIERKDRTIYFAGLRNGETENFFGPVVTGTPVDQTVTLTNLATSSAPAALEVQLQGVTQTPHQTQVKLNGAVVGIVSYTGQQRGKASFAIAQSQLLNGLNTVQLVSIGGSSDISLVDRVKLSYTHTLTADSNLLRPAAKGGQPITIGGFTSPDIRVIDVTDSNNPQELNGSIGGSKNNATITLTPAGAGTKALLAFTDARVMSATVKANVPSNWQEEGLQHDYVMITTGELKASLTPLKALRESQGLSVTVVEVEDLYDEFSFGNKSPQAIKDFLMFTRDNWRQTPRFVLFAGDSSYDPKNYLGFGDSDLVPTKLYDSYYMEAASDDWFVDFQGTGLPSMASGRLPARNASEATALVAKIIGYENSTGSNSVLLNADLDDGYNFGAIGAALRSMLPGSVTVSEINRGSSDDATVKAQILAAINQGKTIVNYNGHGSVNQWRGNILTNEDAASMTNSQKLAMFIMMTCLNGYFDDPVLDSLAESLLKANGGAAAVFASAAQCEPGGQEQLNTELYRLLFSGESITVGEAAARAKQAVGDIDVRRSWILFGDPAMRLK